MEKKEIIGSDGKLKAVIHFSGTKQELYPLIVNLISTHFNGNNIAF